MTNRNSDEYGTAQNWIEIVQDMHTGYDYLNVATRNLRLGYFKRRPMSR